MKKIILTENQYRLLLENRTPPMKEVLGSSFETFKNKFGDSAIKFQQLIDEIFTNKDNHKEDNGNVILISKSGSEIPFENFKNYIQDIVNGKSVFDLQNKFPTVLKGGTVLREKIIELLSNPNDSDEESLEQSEYPLNQTGIKFKEMIESYNKWIQLITPKDGEISGWKLHIYTTTIDEIAYAAQQVYDIVKSTRCGFKLASKGNLERMKGTKQEGKGVSIYIPYDIIKNNQHFNLVNNIASAISNLKTSGSVVGDKSLTDNISYRYEFDTSLITLLNGDYSKGLDNITYDAHYMANSGNYNPVSNNPDIFGSGQNFYNTKIKNQ
jgi:hypothetical protein